MSAVQFCSLIRDQDQWIQPKEYTTIRFPFGSSESWDIHGMHNVEQPDGYTVDSWNTDERSGLIWPSKRGMGYLHATVQFEGGNYSEIRNQFVRDPMNLMGSGPDTTATEHRAPSPGMQCMPRSWEIIVDPFTPIAFRVWHNASGAIRMVHAQFKLSIHDLDEG